MKNIVIETDRLYICEFQENDWKQVHHYAADSEVTQFMIWGPNEVQDTKDFVNLSISQQRESDRKDYEFALWHKDHAVIIGGCGVHVRDERHREGEIGYCLAKEYWRQGYGSELGDGLLNYGFNRLGLHRITAKCDPENVGSYKVMEKIGMKKEGYLRQNLNIRGRWRDSYLYATLEHEYQNGKL